MGNNNRIIDVNLIDIMNGSICIFETMDHQIVFWEYGGEAVGTFRNFLSEHPNLSSEQARMRFETPRQNQQTGFFREPNIAAFSRSIMPRILNTGNSLHLRILNIGCSTGQEAYSLSASILDAGYKDFSITSIDIDPICISQALLATYLDVEIISTPYLPGLPSNLIEKGHFVISGEHYHKNVRYAHVRVADSKTAF